MGHIHAPYATDLQRCCSEKALEKCNIDLHDFMIPMDQHIVVYYSAAILRSHHNHCYENLLSYISTIKMLQRLR